MQNNLFSKLNFSFRAKFLYWSELRILAQTLTALFLFLNQTAALRIRESLEEHSKLMLSRLLPLSRTLASKGHTNQIILPFNRSISSTTRLNRPLIGCHSSTRTSHNNFVAFSAHSLPGTLSRRTIFGFSFPTASNEPLAGTIDGSGPPFLFILQVFIGLPVVLWAYKVSSKLYYQFFN